MKKIALLILILIVGIFVIYFFNNRLKMNVVKSYNFSSPVKKSGFVGNEKIYFCYSENSKNKVAVKNITTDEEDVIELRDNVNDEFTSLSENEKYLFYVSGKKIILYEVETKKTTEYLITGALVGYCWSKDARELYALNYVNNALCELWRLDIEKGKIQDTGIKIKKDSNSDIYIKYQEGSVYLCLENIIYNCDTNKKSCDMIYTDPLKIENFEISDGKLLMLFIENGTYKITGKNGSSEIDISYYICKEKTIKGNIISTSLYDKFKIVKLRDPFYSTDYFSPNGKYLAITGNSPDEFYQRIASKVQIWEIGKKLTDTANIERKDNLFFLGWSSDSKYVLCQKGMGEKDFIVINVK